MDFEQIEIIKRYNRTLAFRLVRVYAQVGLLVVALAKRDSSSKRYSGMIDALHYMKDVEQAIAELRESIDKEAGR